jgi:DNA polymerase-1
LPTNYEDTLQIIKEFKAVLENPKIVKVGQNLKYDMDVLYWYEIQVKGKIFDTMVAHYLIRPEAKHSLDVLAKHYLSYDTVEYKSLFDAKDKVKDIRKVDLELLKDYACEDADITWRLKEKLEEELIEFGVDKVFEEIETPLIPVLTCMENTGVRIDENFLSDLSTDLEGDISILTKKIYEYAGEEFNIASPKQLGIILFEKLKITDKPKLTKTKQYSTGESEMQKLKSKHPIVEVILEYRGLAKLKSTYLDALPKLINPRTNKIHTSYNQAIVATGRLSSNNPNLQNIPIRTEQGRKVRKAFIPSDKDHVLLAADYSQIELRIFASMSQEPNMMEAFRQGVDIHTATAARVFDVKITEVSREQRSKAKMVNFGIIYGISAFGLAERLGISRTEAKEIMTQYFEKYSGIKDFMQQLIDFAKTNEFVETIHKRRRYLRDINSGNGMMRSFAERNAINAPVQGSAADMIKIAMVRVHQELIDKKLKSRMIMQVHDELVLDVLKTEQEEVKEIVERCMVEAMPLDVPVEVDMKFGEDWLEAH